MEPSAELHGKILSVLLAWLVRPNGSVSLSIGNYTDPFIFHAGTPSDISFSISNVDKDQQIDILLLHREPGSMHLKISCHMTVLRNDCTTSNHSCQCYKHGAGGHRYKMTKIFNEHDTGQWYFHSISGNISRKVSINITVSSAATSELSPTFQNETFRSTGGTNTKSFRDGIPTSSSAGMHM